MKLLKLFLPVMILSIAVPAMAQNFDAFGATRQIVLATPTILGGSAATVTNGPIDIHGFQGIAEVTISSCTNAGGALTATLVTSADSTNWTALANFATAVSTSVTVTNGTYGNTNLQFAQTYLLPGTLTVPTTATAGYAQPYLLASAFTNSGAVTITAKGLYRLGFKPSDANRYIEIVWTPTGTSSNDIVSAEFTGFKATEVR
jgi:hypothetical protein